MKAIEQYFQVVLLDFDNFSNEIQDLLTCLWKRGEVLIRDGALVREAYKIVRICIFVLMKNGSLTSSTRLSATKMAVCWRKPHEKNSALVASVW